MKNKTTHTKINFYLDSVLLLAFLVSLFPFRTGLTIHEWLGLAIGGTLVVHTLLHYKWIIAMTKKLSSKLPGQARTYYVLDALLLVTFFTIIASGVLMSRAVLPALGLQGISSLVLAGVHKFATYLTAALLVIKVALHGKWIAHALKSLVPAQPQPETATATSPALGETTPDILSKQISRRRFLIAGCGVACAAVLAGTCALHQHLEESEGDEGISTPNNDNAQVAESTETAGNNAPVAEATETGDSTRAPVAEATTAATESTRNSTRPSNSTRCPHNMVNDPYPGRCHHYTDKNGNNICDLSETA